MDADAVIAALGLEPHPEGGLYRQTWADEAGTSIYFLLRDGAESAWHRLHGRAEIWHFYAGSPVELTMSERSPDDAAARTATLGSTWTRCNGRSPSSLRAGGNGPGPSGNGRSSGAPWRRLSPSTRSNSPRARDLPPRLRGGPHPGAGSERRI